MAKAKQATTAPPAPRATERPIEARSPAPAAQRRSAVAREPRQRRPRFEELYQRATFHVSKDQIQAIDDVCYDLGIGKSEFVRDAIEVALATARKRSA
jgi:hypothetical protein